MFRKLFLGVLGLSLSLNSFATDYVGKASLVNHGGGSYTLYCDFLTPYVCYSINNGILTTPAAPGLEFRIVTPTEHYENNPTNEEVSESVGPEKIGDIQQMGS